MPAKICDKRFLLLFLLGTFLSLYAQSQVPLLSSNSKGLPTIYLDFDGEYVDATSWNWAGPIDAKAASVSSVGIEQIFHAVAEDYSIFNVTVTTDPVVYAAAPPQKRIRVIVTSTSDWYGPVAGTAFTGSFTTGDETPCWVFSSLLKNNLKNISEAISHEVGHTFGLEHQSSYSQNCEKTEYYSGIGTGNTGWAPIMGVSYDKALSTWAIGSSADGCSSIQEDIAVILATPNMISLKPDDHGNSYASATNLPTAGNQISSTGLITHKDDIDFFRLQIPVSTQVILQVLPLVAQNNPFGANIDLAMAIYNSSGQLIKRYSPDTDINVSIDTNLNAGSYFVAIEGIGNNFLPDYGSLGNYVLTGSINTSLPIYQLQLLGTEIGYNHVLRWNISADESCTIVVEYSKDGQNFQRISTSSLLTGTYAWPAPIGNSYYRLSVTANETNTIRYSRIISLNRISGSDIRVSSIVRNSVEIESSLPGTYSIRDLSGREIQRGALQAGQNSISAQGMLRGLSVLTIWVRGQQLVYKLFRN